MLNAICNLRYEICKKENMALSWFLKNRVIVKLVDTSIMDPSTYIPKGVHYSIAKKYGQLIAKTARKALNDESIPYVPTYEAVQNVKSVVAEMDALEKYLIESAKKLCIPKEIFCSKRLILDFFYHCLFTPNKLSFLEEGWRGEFLSGLRMFKDKFAVRQ
jgi:ribonuclease D